MKAGKRLDEMAAKFNLYRPENIPQKFWNDEYFKSTTPERLDRSFGRCGEHIPPYLETMQDLQIGEYVKIEERTKNVWNGKTHVSVPDGFYIEHFYIIVCHEKSDILMMFNHAWQKQGKFDLFPYFGEVRKFHGIENHLKYEAIKSVKEPNRVGVFTDKKVIAWVDYCSEYVSALTGLLENVNNKNAELEKEREEFIEKLTGAKVQRYSDNSTVWVNWNNFQITFNHNKAEKYMSKSVEYRGDINEVLKLHEMLNGKK